MKTLKLTLTLAPLMLCSIAFSQDLFQAQRWIKAGNSLREADQYEQAEQYLTRGLQAARKLHNKYWEAVACENLGMLYIITEQRITSAQYFNDALAIYKSLNMQLSTRVVTELMASHGIAVTEGGSQLYGGIDIGSRGVKFSVVKITSQNGSQSFKILKDGSLNTTVIDFQEKSITATAHAVKLFLDTLKKSHVSMDNIYIAMSSGVKQEADKHPGMEAKVLKTITDSIPSYPRRIPAMDACREGDLTIEGVVPSRVVYNSSLIDIGSGNTKGGIRTREKNSSVGQNCITVPYGTVTFTKKIAGQSDKAGYARKFFADSISSIISTQIQNNGELTNRAHVYFTGGIVWAMTNYMHPETISDDFTAFSKADVDNFLQMATSDYEKLINPDLSRITDPEALKAAKKQIAASRSTFNQDNLIAGATLLRGIMSQMDGTGVPKKYIFIRFGSIGWISGYIVENISNGFQKLSE